MSLWYHFPHFKDRELLKLPANLGGNLRCLRSDFSVCMLRVVLLFILVTAAKAQQFFKNKIAGSQIVCPKCVDREFILFSWKISNENKMEYGFAGILSDFYNNLFHSSGSCSAHLQSIK